MKTISAIGILLVPGLLFVHAFSQGNEQVATLQQQKSDTTEIIHNSGIDLFASEEILQMTLTFDTKEFLKTKNRSEYLDAILTVRTGLDDSITQSIKLRSRGYMRLSYCSFPPIMLKFRGGGQEDDRIIQRKGNLKLVTHCQTSAAFEGYVFKEYLAYRLYNLVTPYSFKTRLVKVNYIDVNRPDKSFAEYGFLIEDDDKMAERNNAVVIKAMNATQKHMVPLEMARVAVFNYMIGNTDWSVPYQHNIKILKSLHAPSDKAIPVAYDFDYSGLVNTIYAVPFEELPIKDVAQRYYLGLCDQNEEVVRVLEEFRGLHDQFLETIDNFEYLSKNDRKQVESYISSFYKRYNYKNYMISDLTNTCKRF